jgi:phosphoesterase RecJ-like protein
VTTATTWTTNATAADIVERLQAAQRIAVLTHAKPDGDALGSTLAVTRAMHIAGMQATPLYIGPWPSRFDPLLGDTHVVHEHHGCWDKPPMSDADCFLITDTGSWNQIADARTSIEGRAADTIIIDHHRHGDAEIADRRLIDTHAAAACEIVADLCCLLLGVSLPSQLPPAVAEPLYLGIATDTGWFRYSNLRPQTLRLAADLLDAGVDADRLFQISDQNDPPARLELMRKALASLELHDNARVAVMVLTQADFEAAGASLDEASGIIDMPKSVGAVRVVALLTEVDGTLSKVSLRSKAGEDPVDVNLVAQQFGGGGHKHAAGAKIKAPIDEARRQITEALTR